MIYPEEVVLKELMWEYDYSQEQAESILLAYKQNGKYYKLCQLIEHKASLEEVANV